MYPVCFLEAWAHPRVCGENTQPTQRLMRSGGSSPRVRGKRSGVGVGVGLVGLIPACAGKTRAQASYLSGAEAHPRVCGENSSISVGPYWGHGSSPRVRGKPLAPKLKPRGRRLIPACAGKTPTLTVCSVSHRAHPRVCGENIPHAFKSP